MQSPSRKRELDQKIFPKEHLSEGEHDLVHEHLDNYDAYVAAHVEHEKACERYRKARKEHADIATKSTRSGLNHAERLRAEFVSRELREHHVRVEELRDKKESALAVFRETHGKMLPIMKRIHGDRAVTPGNLAGKK